jgi:uncharacterized membrane protein
MSAEKTNNQNKDELTATRNQLQNSPYKQLEQMEMSFSGEIYHGPLPDPEMLEKYKNADPSFPNRIVKMAENHNAADVGIKKGMTFSTTIIPVMGQLFTFLLGAGSLTVCVYLAQKGFTGGAIAAVVAGFAPIIINALKGFKQNDHSKQNNN